MYVWSHVDNIDLYVSAILGNVEYPLSWTCVLIFLGMRQQFVTNFQSGTSWIASHMMIYVHDGSTQDCLESMEFVYPVNRGWYTWYENILDLQGTHILLNSRHGREESNTKPREGKDKDTTENSTIRWLNNFKPINFISKIPLCRAFLGIKESY